MTETKLTIEDALEYYNYNDMRNAEKVIVKLLEEETDRKVKADLLCLRGAIRYQQKNLTEAEQFYREGTDIYRAEHEETDLAAACNNLGVIRRAIKDIDGAEAAYRESIDIFRRLASQSNEYRATLTTYINNLGNLYSFENRLDDAIALYRESLEIIRQLAPLDDGYRPLLANSLNNLGIHYNQLKKYDEAEDYYVESVNEWEALVKGGNKDVDSPYAAAVSNLAALYRLQSRYGKAEKLYRLALELRERIHNEYPSNPIAYDMLAEAHIKFGNMLRDDSRNEEAAVEYKAAVPIREELEQRKAEMYGPKLAMTYYNIAALYFNDMQLKTEAREYFIKARDCALKYYNTDPDCAAMVMRIRNLPEQIFGEENDAE